jgi:hypothetical protein
MALGGKTKVVLALVLIVGAVAGWQGLRYWWFHGYSVGERTGIIRKISVKGTPVCKYLEGELVLTGIAGQPSEVWTFSTDDHSDANPIVGQLKDAERDGTRVTLHYRQDLKSWYRCTPNEYFVTSIETMKPVSPPPPAAPAAPAPAPVAPPAAK